MTTRSRGDGSQSRAYIQAHQPWGDAVLARLYDAFPFDADISLYLELAREQGGRVLEPACGSGRVLVPMVEAGNSVVGLDVSPHMLDLAREKLAAKGPGVEGRARLEQGDMRTFDLGEQFDLAVIAVKSFAYLTSRSDQQQTLADVAKHLRPGGLLALDLLNPSPAWLLEPSGSLHQDQVAYVPSLSATVARTETAVSTDAASQTRVIRSAYEVIADDGSVRKRMVEWPYRYTYRFEAELLLEGAGLNIEGLFGGYANEAFVSDSRVMLFLARKT